MVSPSDISSAKEHYDVVMVLLVLSLGALLTACLYIIKTHQNNDTKTDLIVEQHTKDLVVLQSLKIGEKQDEHTLRIAKLYTALCSIIIAYNLHHPDQKIELPK